MGKGISLYPADNNRRLRIPEEIMKIGIVFHKNPISEPVGIDLVRLRAIAKGLAERGALVDIIAPVPFETDLDGIPVKTPEALRTGRHDIIKTCYHYSMELLGDHSGIVVSRIVRVVDEKLPERDEPCRKRLLECQELIRRKSSVLALNNVENAERWEALYGQKMRIVTVPTGCPAIIPPRRNNPYPAGKIIMLFLGSLAAPRMIDMINGAAERLPDPMEIHFVGRNKTGMYGGSAKDALHPSIVRHGEMPEDRIWDYIRFAHLGLALATGPYAFDNDVSKILNYLRGGLPVLSESPIVNNDLITITGWGIVFSYGNVEDLVSRASALVASAPPRKKQDVIEYMISNHSWKNRVDTYMGLFNDLLNCR